MKRRFPILALVLVGLLPLPATAQTQQTPLTVTIVGAVNKPGVYQMPSTGLTLLQALAISGGLQPTANSSGAKVVRQAPGAVLTIPIDLRSILSGKQRDVLLQPGDVISIPFSMKPTFEPVPPQRDPIPPQKDIARVEVRRTNTRYDALSVSSRNPFNTPPKLSPLRQARRAERHSSQSRMWACSGRLKSS